MRIQMRTDKKPEEPSRTLARFSLIFFLTVHFDPVVREALAFSANQVRRVGLEPTTTKL
jgi:hypothetical protein